MLGSVLVVTRYLETRMLCGPGEVVQHRHMSLTKGSRRINAYASRPFYSNTWPSQRAGIMNANPQYLVLLVPDEWELFSV